MTKDSDLMAYMMAAEKMSNLIFTMESTVEFLIEYKIEADEEVKKCLNPLIQQLQNWLNNLK